METHLPCSGNSPPFNGNQLPFMETIFEKQGIIICGNHFRKTWLEKKNPFLMLYLLKNIWVSTAYNCALHM
jgi:hypothetical protein